ncbi:MAG: hypothetical protein Q8898_08255 [Bacillota bacterium]|nr:hypothetical protein [Bacillota bacterium]
MKKLIVSLLLIMSICTGAFAATTSVQPPISVGTYVDFNHEVRLQWKPVPGAVAYKVYLAQGYNAKTGFKLQYTLKNYSLIYDGRQYWIISYVSTPKISWDTIRVTSIDKYGHESIPCVTNVNVWR